MQQAHVVQHQLMHWTPPQTFLLLFFPFLVVLLHLVISTTTSAARPSHGRRLPPSPPRLPIIGHLHLLGLLPHVSLRNLADKYGRDYMLIHLGSMRSLVVSSPRAAEAIMRTHDHMFASRPLFPAIHGLLYGSLDVVAAVHGEHWRKSKKLFTTHLVAAKKVQSYRPDREEEVRLAVAKIREAATASQCVDMSELLYSFTADMMCRAVSGKFFKVDGRNRLLRELVRATAKLVGGFNLEDFFPRLAQLGAVKRATRAKVDKVKRRWDELLDEAIDEHQGRVLQQQEPDFIDVLLSHQQEHGLTRDHTKALLIDAFFGGMESSYLVLEYAMAELMLNPHIMSKLQAELRGRSKEREEETVTEDDLADMAYLKAVIKETFRLHPPGPLLIPHLSMDNVHVDGFTIPANTAVFVNAWALGRDASIWEDVEVFKPERFIDADINFGKNFELLPFGAGRRMCPGISFSISNIEIMLGNLLYHFDWELPAEMQDKGLDMTEEYFLTVHRKEKLLLLPKTMHAYS